MKPAPPRCPIHNVRMRLLPELPATRVGKGFNSLQARTVHKLNGFWRWRCRVPRCARVESREKELE